jgi:hypothetical protein
MHKSAMKCNETVSKWCKNKHGVSKIIDTLETYHFSSGVKFSPRVKLMMDQSRAELRALTEALSAADTAAAGSPLLAAVDLPLADSPVVAGVVAMSCAQPISEGPSPSSSVAEPSPMQRVNEATISAIATVAAGSPSPAVVALPLAYFATAAGDAATTYARPIVVGSSPASATSDLGLAAETIPASQEAVTGEWGSPGTISVGVTVKSPATAVTPFRIPQGSAGNFYRERRRLLILSSLRRQPTNFLQAREILGAEVWQSRPLAL